MIPIIYRVVEFCFFIKKRMDMMYYIEYQEELQGEERAHGEKLERSPFVYRLYFGAIRL